MNRALRLIEILWLAVAAVSLVEAVKAWGTWSSVIKFALIFGAAVFMYFFRKKSRKKNEAKHNHTAQK